MAECERTGERSGTTEHLVNEDKQFICNICMGHYKIPRYLTRCGHTFCEKCLLKYIHNVELEGQGSKFVCPTCRRPSDRPVNHEVTLEWVQTFPLNTVVIKMMESLPQSSQEVPEERRMCSPCEDEGETSPGVKFCLDCKEVLCKECTKCHRKFKMSKNHKLMDVSEMPAATNLVDSFAQAAKCPTHLDKDMEGYCKTHDLVVCAKCLMHEHKTCELLELPDQDADVASIQTDSEVLTTRMKSIIEHLRCLKETKLQIKDSLKKNLKEIRERIEKIKEQVVQLMEQIVDNVIAITKQIEIEEEDRSDAGMIRISMLQEDTERKLATLDMVQQHGLQKHKFITTLSMKKQCKELEKQITEEDYAVNQIDADLNIDESLRKVIQSTNMEKLVQVNTTESKSSHKFFAGMATPLDDTNDEHNDLRESGLVKVEDHTVNPVLDYYSDYEYEVEEYEANYCGIATHEDGRVILSDNSYQSGLFVYNPADETMLNMNMCSGPYSAVMIDALHLAVSLPNSDTISIVTVGSNDLVVGKTLQTPYTPRVIVALKDGQLAVAWRDPTAFGIIDISGEEVVQKLYMDEDANGRKFSSFEYLAVDERRQHIIQPCFEDVAIYCFDYEGKPVFKYTDHELAEPRGVALDRCGNIYVCDNTYPGIIHKLDPTGQQISVFTDGIPNHPLAICSDNTGTGFWVTHDDEAFNDITYFRLEAQNELP